MIKKITTNVRGKLYVLEVKRALGGSCYTCALGDVFDDLFDDIFHVRHRGHFWKRGKLSLVAHQCHIQLQKQCQTLMQDKIHFKWHCCRTWKTPLKTRSSSDPKTISFRIPKLSEPPEVAKHLSASNELENHVQIAMVLKRREKERGEITAWNLTFFPRQRRNISFEIGILIRTNGKDVGRAWSAIIRHTPNLRAIDTAWCILARHMAQRPVLWSFNIPIVNVKRVSKPLLPPHSLLLALVVSTFEAYILTPGGYP